MFTISKNSVRTGSISSILRDNLVTAGIGLLVLIHLVGVVGLLSPFKELLLSFTPAILLIDLVLLLSFHESWSRTTTMAMIFCGILGFSLEVIGVHTGVLFGEYTYGPVLGFKVLGVPLIIGINWLLLVYVTATIASTIVSRFWLRVIIASFLMVMIDILIEPVAIQYNFWQWEGDTIPLRNFVAWFLISAVMVGMFYKLKINFNNRIAFALYLILVSFFGLLNIV